MRDGQTAGEAQEGATHQWRWGRGRRPRRRWRHRRRRPRRPWLAREERNPQV